MNRSIAEFWEHFAASEILNEQSVSGLQTALAAAGGVDLPEQIADWLCGQQAISRFQADVLLAGCGPLRIGNYVIVQPVEKQPATFHAIHFLTRHPVDLTFVGGSDGRAIESWRSLKREVGRWQSIRQLNLQTAFESVALPEYRFAVCERLSGDTLDRRLPENARLAPADAAKIAFQIASALAACSTNEIVHGRVGMDSIWLDQRNRVQLQTIFADSDFDKAETELNGSDTNSLAAIWFRLLAGKPLASANSPGTSLQTLWKYGVASTTSELIERLAVSDASEKDLLEQVLKHCDEVYSVDSSEPASKNPSLEKYESWLARTPEKELPSVPVHGSHELSGLQLQDESSQRADDPTELIAVGAARPPDSGDRRNRKSVSTMAVACWTSGVFLALASATIAILASLDRTGTSHSDVAIATESPEVSSDDPGVESPRSIRTDPEPDHVNESTSSDLIQQILIPDDGQTLWETPTTGPPIDFSRVPPAPKIAMHIRPMSLLDRAEGGRLLAALGPGFNDWLEGWQKQLGFDLSSISELQITLHRSRASEYQPFLKIEFSDKVDLDEFEQRFGQTEQRTAESGESYQSREDGFCYYSTDGGSHGGEMLLVATEALLLESIEMGEASPLTGSLKRLAQFSDSDRHLTILFLRAGLFDGAGQQLMQPLSSFNRQLGLALDDRVRGGNLSFHLEGGTYLEMTLDQTADMKDGELAAHTAYLINQLRFQLSEYANQVAAAEYWEAVRAATPKIYERFEQNWRIGVEDKRVIGNCWLPSEAAHNLVASIELLNSFGDAEPAAWAGNSESPGSLEELLAEKRDLSVANSPDLIILLDQLQQEIRDDYRDLPFEFEIRINAGDLAKDGITQNQRPGDFDLRQRPLGEILTEIMVRANPDRDISGPADPNCKLVWVAVADPEDTGRQIVIVTTRSAASDRSWTLPAEFLQ